jgi:hypothetical protein
VAGTVLLSACSISIPGFGSDDGPKTTGSIAIPVEVQEPLPQTLAYSDAAKIGEAAAAVLWQAESDSAHEWINAATGSSGTVENGAAEDATGVSSACRIFTTDVTSVGGVHRYAGKICRRDNGRSIVEIGAPGEERGS